MISLQKLFDPEQVIDGSLFKEDAMAKVMESGRPIEIVEERPDGFTYKVIDQHASQGYNVFKSKDEYNQWLQASLYEPSQDEMEGALNGDGA